MVTETIDAISTHLESAQTEHALTDRSVAAAIQLFTRTGDFPKGLSDESLQTAVVEAAWLLFVAAPAVAPRYLIVSSMHLNLTITGEYPLAKLFEEIGADVEKDEEEFSDSPGWLEEYRQIGRQPLPEQNRLAELQKCFEKVRTILRENHDEVVEFSRHILDTIAAEFDQQVEQGELSPLGAAPDVDIDDSADALEAAGTMQKEGDLVGAMSIYSAVLEETPDNLEALVHRGILRASFEDLSAACEDFDRAIELDEDHLVARLNRALARHSMGEVEAALEDYDHALSRVDGDAEIWVNRGIARFSARDLDGALHDLNRAIELDDTMATAYLQRGNVHRVRNQGSDALRDYEKAIELNPDFADAYAARAYLHLQLVRVDDAIADFNRAIELQPADPTLYYNRAHAHLLNEDVEAALADYDRSLELDPEDVEALSNRGAARMMNGDLDGAVGDWEEAIAINPYYPTPYLKRASMWIATEQPEEAARDLQIALDNAPEDWPYRDDVEETLKGLLDELGFDQPD